MLLCTHTIIFGTDGEVLPWETYHLGQPFFEEPISIKRFYIPEHRVGIIDVTETMHAFVENTPGECWSEEEQREFPELIREWMNSGKYVFDCDGADFYMNSQGYVRPPEPGSDMSSTPMQAWPTG